MQDTIDFFEGTEKLLEIWFTTKDEKPTEDNDLRLIPRDVLDELLDTVNCKILSKTTTRDIDSYVLSESSLFINKNRLLIKT
jgi:S-adenosylmethionine decarboxylase